ncbi:MAG TPA: non-homologous end-joining DNA ligase [Gemmatimonadales bacterium]|jgi:bifunctional non-homologous end joining protein LigD|nr:non-homologous end-joining DNA ligase [Gemmatimonadales bacterium]
MKVAGIELSNPDRVLYPEQGLTKQDLALYYEAIAPWMLPHVAGRPFSLVRCPGGRQKACFYQKHWSGRLPTAVETVDIEEGKGGVRPYTVIVEAAGLVSLVQYGVLEFHLWGARADQLESPDRIVFDVDPAPGVSWGRVREAAKLLKGMLETLGLESWIKTTGGKGLHVVVPIERRSSWEEVSGFARAVAYRIAREDPARYLATASKAARQGRIFIDWLRNTRGATAIAPWSTRAREGAPISMPIGWEELDRLKSGDQFLLRGAVALARRRKPDPWASLLKARQRLTRSLTAALEA